MTSGEQIWLNTYYLHQDAYDAATGRPPMTAQYFIWTETAQERMIRLLKA